MRRDGGFSSELLKRERVVALMAKLNLAANGILRLPPGFRFHPTDEELVVQYLGRKAFSCPLPGSIIPEIDFSRFDPWDLPGNSERERYFFTRRESKYPSGNRANRASGSGYWKATGRDKQVFSARMNQVVGMKKVLVFYRGKPPKGGKTDWIMHEYRLSDSAARTPISPQGKDSMKSSILPMTDWVLCRLFLKKRSSKEDVELTQPSRDNRVRDLSVGRTILIDFMNRRPTESSDDSSDSESSTITELSSAGSPQEEISSSSSLGREA